MYSISAMFVCHWMNQMMLCFAVPISTWHTNWSLEYECKCKCKCECECVRLHGATLVYKCITYRQLTLHQTNNQTENNHVELSIVQHHFISVAIAKAFRCASCTHSCHFSSQNLITSKSKRTICWSELFRFSWNLEKSWTHHLSIWFTSRTKVVVRKVRTW